MHLGSSMLVGRNPTLESPRDGSPIGMVVYTLWFEWQVLVGLKEEVSWPLGVRGLEETQGLIAMSFEVSWGFDCHLLLILEVATKKYKVIPPRDSKQGMICERWTLYQKTYHKHSKASLDKVAEEGGKGASQIPK